MVGFLTSPFIKATFKKTSICIFGFAGVAGIYLSWLQYRDGKRDAETVLNTVRGMRLEAQELEYQNYVLFTDLKCRNPPVPVLNFEDWKAENEQKEAIKKAAENERKNGEMKDDHGA